MVVKALHMRRGALLGLVLLAAAGGASAQMYKWVDANGKTHFSDRPPPANAKPAEVKAGPAARGAVELPYGLATAVRASPVTLFTTSNCSGCDLGRTYLKTRGVPFTEKTVTTAADGAALLQAGGDGNMPFLLVGGAKVTGFQPSAWGSALTAARYPTQKTLPANYRYPAPQAAGAAAAVKAEPAPAAQAAPEEPRAVEPPPPRNAPPGFKF